MKDGFLKVAAGTPEIRVADCLYNAESIIRLAKEAARMEVRLLALPELCLTGYTCADLFFQPVLLEGARTALQKLAAELRELPIVVVAGLPVAREGKLYNCAAVLYRGEVLGICPKTVLPNYNEFYEKRWFEPAPAETGYISIFGKQAPFGSKLLFRCKEMPEWTLGVEICEDLWSAQPPSVGLACAGATVLANLSASDETVGKAAYRRGLVTGQSGRLLCGYIYTDAGEGESTTDMVFSGHNLIAENGILLAESERFTTGLTVSELDLQKIELERRKMTSFPQQDSGNYWKVSFSMPLAETVLSRNIPSHPFIPQDPAAMAVCCEEILNIQSAGLKQRLRHSGAKTAVVGISGGLDSALALLVTARAMDRLNRPRTDILAVTMPCFGTTSRTLGNARELSETIGAELMQVDISDAVRIHFRDVGIGESDRDVGYENAQARERTQVLMDLANRRGGLVIGTGDLSELALGWATYNGDHMSMYGVNASVPKTLVRHLVAYEAGRTGNAVLRDVLLDILETPVSPELLPADGKEISQKTEEIVGPYDLHDFFLYYGIRWGFGPGKVFRLACAAFQGEFSRETILKWLKVFYRRFFTQQFKRSCQPDGPKVGSVSLSPRGDWRMPSDASCKLWMDQAESLH